MAIEGRESLARGGKVHVRYAEIFVTYLCEVMDIEDELDQRGEGYTHD
jgi:hypothetical protein